MGDTGRWRDKRLKRETPDDRTALQNYVKNVVVSAAAEARNSTHLTFPGRNAYFLAGISTPTHSPPWPGPRNHRMDAEALFRQHLPLIEQIAQSICRRNGVPAQEAEDFVSDMRLKLCEADYGVIRKFQGKSSFTTYLTVVISKGFLDHRRRTWGKWSPSSRAKRFGPVAILLEKLVYRDGYTFDAACQTIAQKHAIPVERRKLQSMLAELPRRSPRRVEGGDGLEDVASAERADTRVLAVERDDQLAAAEAALRRALEQLADEERAIVRMIYYEGLSVAEIARGLGLEQMRLYPRIRQLLTSLRRSLAAEGISSDFLEQPDSS